jgi:hypothetical protein
MRVIRSLASVLALIGALNSSNTLIHSLTSLTPASASSQTKLVHAASEVPYPPSEQAEMFVHLYRDDLERNLYANRVLEAHMNSTPQRDKIYEQDLLESELTFLGNPANMKDHVALFRRNVNANEQLRDLVKTYIEQVKRTKDYNTLADKREQIINNNEYLSEKEKEGMVLLTEISRSPQTPELFEELATKLTQMEDELNNENYKNFPIETTGLTAS